MKIREVHIENYGKIKDKKITFSEGINLIYGGNEYGKSTLYSFIKTMIFGVERKRGRASKKDSFTLYNPWNYGGFYGGSLVFESGGKDFFLKRYFEKEHKVDTLICEEDGEVLSIEQGDLSVLLGQMTEAQFENTVSIGQARVETTQELARYLEDYGANISKGSDGEIQIEQALLFLKQEKKGIEKSLRDLQTKKRQEIEVIELEERMQLKECKKIEEKLQEKSVDSKNGIVAFWLGIGVVLTSLVLFLILQNKAQYISLLLAVLSSCFVLKNWKKKQYERWEYEKLVKDYKEKKTVLENLSEEKFEKMGIGPAVKMKSHELDAIELACERIKMISREMQNRHGKVLNDRVSEIFSIITDGAYDRIFLKEDAEIFIYKEGRQILLEQLSRGTLEQVYFALRMTVSELYLEESMPLIFDDTFVFYDEERLGLVLKWLEQSKKQVIIFTCQKREQEIMNKHGIKYNQEA